MDFLAPLIFFIIFVVSIANKIQETRKLKDRQQKRETPQQLSDKARQQLHGDRQPNIQTAKAASPATMASPPVVQTAGGASKPAGQELIESLFGVEITEEGVRPATAAPPSPAPSAPPPVPAEKSLGDRLRAQRMEEQRRHNEADAARNRAELMSVKEEEARRSQRPRQQERKRAQQRQRQPQQTRQPQRTRPPQQQTRPRQVPVALATGRYLASPQELRRAIVLAEILGPPKAFREDAGWSPRA